MSENSPSWDDDETLLAELGIAIRAGEQVPQHFVEAGKQAFTWRGVDAELAELSYDSAADAGRLALARSADAVLRALTFTAGDVVLEIEITAEAVRGQVLPMDGGVAELVGRDGTVSTAAVDADGWFAVSPVPADSFTLTVRTGSGLAISTGWIAR